MDKLYRLAQMDRILRKLSPVSEEETVSFLTDFLKKPGRIEDNIKTFLSDSKNHIMYSSMEVYYRYLLTGIPPLDNMLNVEELQEAKDKVIKGYKNYLDNLFIE